MFKWSETVGINKNIASYNDFFLNSKCLNIYMRNKL